MRAALGVGFIWLCLFYRVYFDDFDDAFMLSEFTERIPCRQNMNTCVD